MKNSILKNFIFLILLISPLLAIAVTPGQIPTAGGLGIKEEPPVKTAQGLLDVITGIVKWVYTIFFVIAVLFLLLAAFNYLTAGGNPEKVKTAHTQLIYTAIAIAIALLAVGATAIIKDVLGGGKETIPYIELPPGTVFPPPVSI